MAVIVSINHIFIIHLSQLLRPSSWLSGQAQVRSLSLNVFFFFFNESLVSIPFAEEQRYARRRRTHFSAEQLQALKQVFEETMYPDWVTMMELISSTQLDESVIKTWFKNQRVKRKKEQQQTDSNSSLKSSSQTISIKEEQPPLPVTSANTHPGSPSILDACDHELPQSPDSEQSAGAGPSKWNSSWDSPPHDLQQICLGDPDPPWASIPYDIDQLIQLYALPGDDDLDQYLSPRCPSSGDTADIPTLIEKDL
ncbi:paired-like homeodomain transcription factor LEUTX [Panthera tigris]|uniref:paired-like homeodomain transcription factor LEUTX n=1 Tax=Panthera tigris TaxID=9694 RepID=UPI001C6F9879|nr:paired-like homeodomain transcription factor LEUTX [Panthera tigris]